MQSTAQDLPETAHIQTTLLTTITHTPLRRPADSIIPFEKSSSSVANSRHQKKEALKKRWSKASPEALQLALLLFSEQSCYYSLNAKSEAECSVNKPRMARGRGRKGGLWLADVRHAYLMQKALARKRRKR